MKLSSDTVVFIIQQCTANNKLHISAHEGRCLLYIKIYKDEEEFM